VTGGGQRSGPLALARLVRAGGLAAALAVAAVGVVRLIAVGLLGLPAEFEPFHWRALVVSTLAGVAGAVIVFAVLDRLTRRPVRWFWVVSTVVLILSFSGPLSLLGADPPGPGTSVMSVWTLNVMHTVVAAVCVATLTTVGRTRAR
jgi:hypothetical protein